MLGVFRPLVTPLALLPFAFGIWVNQTAPYPPTTRYVAARCTRYCANQGCPYATARSSPAYVRLKPLYALTIRALSVGGSGLHGLLNILFYLVPVPGLLLWLTYSALRDARTIRHLRRATR